MQTRDGRPVRILATDTLGLGDYPAQPILAIVPEDGEPQLLKFWEDGKFLQGRTPCVTDLVNVPEKQVRYVNIYPTKIGWVHLTKREAEECRRVGRIACIRVEFTEGDGL